MEIINLIISFLIEVFIITVIVNFTVKYNLDKEIKEIDSEIDKTKKLLKTIEDEQIVRCEVCKCHIDKEDSHKVYV